MLDRYCAYHLDDLGAHTPEKLVEFKGQCTGFMESIKTVDRELYREIMEMSTPKQLSYIKSIYESHNPSELELELESDSDSILADFKALADSHEDGVISENTAGDFLNRLIDRIRAMLSKIGDVWDNSTDGFKFLGVGVAGAIIFKLLVPILSLGASIFWILATSPIIFMTLTMLAVLAFIPFGPNQISGVNVLLNSFKKVLSNHVPITTELKNINIVLSTDMRNCLNSNIGQATPNSVKNHIVYNLLFRDRGDEMISPAAIAADKALSCILSYITNAIAEMYSSLLECIKNTSGETPIHPYNITSLDATLATLDLKPECQSISDAVHDYTSLFDDVLSAAFSNDSKSMRFWRDSLRKQINKVLGGTHASPIKNATRGIPKSYNNKVIVYDKSKSVKDLAKKKINQIIDSEKKKFNRPKDAKSKATQPQSGGIVHA